MNAELIASSVLPLLVALFNLLVAGYAFASARGERTRLAFGIGSAGIGIWAVAWFVSLTTGVTEDSMRVLGGLGGVLAIGGFAVDSVAQLPFSRGAKLVAAALAVFVAGTLVIYFGLWLYEFHQLSFTLRFAAAELIGVVAAARWSARDLSDPKEERIRWQVLFTIAVCTAAYAMFAIAALADGGSGVDPLLLVILVSECLTLVYIVNRRVEVRILVSRAISYVILSLGVTVFAAVTLKALDYPVAAEHVAVTVAIALFAAILFIGLGEVMSSGVELLLFPERARLSRALGASRAEAAAMKRRLERAERLAIIGELAASVAHEIKNPLAPIRGYAQLLANKHASIAEAEREIFERGLRIIREESDRIDRRVQELLTLARAEKPVASSEQTLELNRVVLEAVAVTQGEEGAGEIVHELDETIDRVVGHEDEIRGALINLLKNAAEAQRGTDGARIDVITRVENGRAIVEVKDEGVGLQPEQCDRVFQAFYTTKEGGTGLGMAISRSAVEAAGGTIKIAPRADRRGAIVHVELSRAEMKGNQ